MGEMAFGSIKPPCPALIKENGLYSCAIIITEEDFFKNPILADALGIGKGCDMVKDSFAQMSQPLLKAIL